MENNEITNQTSVPQQSVDAVPQQPRELTSSSFLRKHKWLLPALMVIFLSLGATGFLAYQNYQLKKQIAQIQILPKPTPTPSPSTAILAKDEFPPAIKAEFQKIKEKYNGEVLETNKLGIWWISSDDLNIINDDSSGIELYIFNCEGDFKSKSIFKEITQLIGPKIDEIMKQNGFQTNQRNSSESIEDSQFYDYIQAYENETVKCVFEANPDCGTYSKETQVHYTFSFGCTEAFDRNYQQQAPYLKDLGIDDAIIHVQKKIGDFVELDVNFRRSGHYTIAKLISGKWNEIFSGQDIPSCEIVEKYEIPKEIISDCYPSEPQN
jgi:hypothetical protein